MVATLGERIKVFREVAGLTQAQLAEAVEVDRTQVVRWEKGQTQPWADKIAPLAQALSVTANQLLGLDEVATEPSMSDIIGELRQFRDELRQARDEIEALRRASGGPDRPGRLGSKAAG